MCLWRWVALRVYRRAHACGARPADVGSRLASPVRPPRPCPLLPRPCPLLALAHVLLPWQRCQLELRERRGRRAVLASAPLRARQLPRVSLMPCSTCVHVWPVCACVHACVCWCVEENTRAINGWTAATSAQKARHNNIYSYLCKVASGRISLHRMRRAQVFHRMRPARTRSSPAPLPPPASVRAVRWKVRTSVGEVHAREWHFLTCQRHFLHSWHSTLGYLTRYMGTRPQRRLACAADPGAYACRRGGKSNSPSDQLGARLRCVIARYLSALVSAHAPAPPCLPKLGSGRR